MVGNSLRRDYEGARRSGMGFIWIAPEDVQAAAERSGADRPAFPVVSELPGLLDILT